MFWFFLDKWNEEEVEKIKWLWQVNDNQHVQNIQNQHSRFYFGGYAKILLAFIIIMIPAVLWVELTGHRILQFSIILTNV